MIKVSTTAAEQIKSSAKEGQMEGMALRLAAKQAEDGSIQYAMGFADLEKDDDVSFDSEGVKILVSTSCYELLKNTEIDYVQLDDGEHHIIFKNPNDPNYKPASSDGEHHF